jgi:hypothetical protein
VEVVERRKHSVDLPAILFATPRVNPGILFAWAHCSTSVPSNGSANGTERRYSDSCATPPIGGTRSESVNAALASRWSLCPQ